MNDEMRSVGLSAYEGYTLGRLSAQSQQVLRDAVETFARRRSRSATAAVDVNALLSENESLQFDLAATQTELSALRNSYNELDAWATKTSTLLRKQGLIKN